MEGETNKRGKAKSTFYFTGRSELSASSISHKGQVRGPTQNRIHHAVNKAQDKEQEDHVVTQYHQLEPESSLTWGEDPNHKHRQCQEHIQNHRLHSVEPGESAQAWIPNHRQIQSKKGYKASIRHRPEQGLVGGLAHCYIYYCIKPEGIRQLFKLRQVFGFPILPLRALKKIIQSVCNGI